ncbi:MAG TPA: DNA-binding protein [Bacteroidia bacterium]|nr:DNA-binding protein [Bacteroidia bacterium]
MPPVNAVHHAIRLTPGQDIKLQIKSFVETNNINAGWIVTCVGSLIQAHLRLAGQKEGKTFEGPFEIVSLVGTVSTAGSHLHICLSDSKGVTIGGHLLEGNQVHTTAEIIMGTSSAGRCESEELIFSRELDVETGWKELKIKTIPG